MQITIEIPSERIALAIKQAHSRAWATALDFDTATMTGTVVESDGQMHHNLDVARGVALLAQVSPAIFGRLLANDMDGPMGDVLLQLCAGLTWRDPSNGELTTKYV